MAFLGRVGNILRQATNKKISSELCSFPSVFQAIRCMSNAPCSKLFIGGVSYSTDEQSLREIFSKYGQVVDARLVMDRETARSRGFGFITYSTVEEASSALQALDGQDLHGCRVKVAFVTERPRGFGSGGGGGSFDGSYAIAPTPYGAGAGTGYPGSYGNSPYGAAASGGGYGDAGGGNAAGGYGSGRYGGGGYGSGSNFGGSSPGNNYGDAGAYGGNAAGGYGRSGYGGASGGNFGGSSSGNNYGAGGGDSGSGMNYGNNSSFASGSTYNNGSSGVPGGGGWRK